jgi:copper oxidase (laccase) domain-containing protein
MLQFADLNIYHSTLDEWPYQNLLKRHPEWTNAFQMQQVHGDKAVEITGLSSPAVVPECDALISSNAKQILIIKTADCVPIAITDIKKKSLGAVHAGRAGTQKKILTKTLQQMIQNGSQPADLYVYLGPSIGPCCYEINRQTHEIYDLWKHNYDQAVSLSISSDHIKLSGVCTHCHQPKKYYSYRSGDLEKRFFTVVSKIQS